MSELISGKEALIALANGEKLQQNVSGEWIDIRRDISWRAILGEQYEFRLKPRTVNLNGVEVGQPESSHWSGIDQSNVILKFKSQEDALNFHNNILKIFNAI